MHLKNNNKNKRLKTTISDVLKILIDSFSSHLFSFHFATNLQLLRWGWRVRIEYRYTGITYGRSNDLWHQWSVVCRLWRKTETLSPLVVKSFVHSEMKCIFVCCCFNCNRVCILNVVNLSELLGISKRIHTVKMPYDENPIRTNHSQLVVGAGT